MSPEFERIVHQKRRSDPCGGVHRGWNCGASRQAIVRTHAPVETIEGGTMRGESKHENRQVPVANPGRYVQLELEVEEKNLTAGEKSHRLCVFLAPGKEITRSKKSRRWRGPNSLPLRFRSGQGANFRIISVLAPLFGRPSGFEKILGVGLHRLDFASKTVRI